MGVWLRFKQWITNRWLKGIKLYEVEFGRHSLSVKDKITFKDSQTPVATGEVGFDRSGGGGTHRMRYWDGSVAKNVANTDELSGSSPTGAIWRIETTVPLTPGSMTIDISTQVNCAYLMIFAELKANTGAPSSHNLFMKFNGVASSYDNHLGVIKRNQTTIGATSQDDGQPDPWALAGRIPGGGVNANLFGVCRINIYNPYSTVRWKTWNYYSWENEESSNLQLYCVGGGNWANTAKINNITFGANAFTALYPGSKVTIYGMGGSVS